ncbi:hypothetical protein KR018_003516 [Drosophila ironensis]|nr:hypothetical protein KR018_003516 [Drosophila ironensis]
MTVILPGQSTAGDIVCKKGVVYEIVDKTYLHDRRPLYILCLYYLGSDPEMHNIMITISNAHENLYNKRNYFCVAQYDCKKNPLKIASCSNIKRSEIFMFKGYAPSGFHHRGKYDIDGITEFIREAQKPESLRFYGINKDNGYDKLLPEPMSLILGIGIVFLSYDYICY